MRTLYKLPKLESREDKKLNFYFILVLIGIVLIAVSFILMGKSYHKTLGECIDLGYDIEYCEMMLN